MHTKAPTEAFFSQRSSFDPRIGTLSDTVDSVNPALP